MTTNSSWLQGGIVARFVIDDTSVCFINCHLAAGQHHVRQRNADVTAMLEDKAVFPESNVVEEPLAYINGGDGSMVLDHEVVFVGRHPVAWLAVVDLRRCRSAGI